jgi:hypothetical protein
LIWIEHKIVNFDAFKIKKTLRIGTYGFPGADPPVKVDGKVVMPVDEPQLPLAVISEPIPV